MNIVAKIIAFMNNFFRTCAKYARAPWEFRIRFSIEKRSWVIELHENGDQQWKTLNKLGEETEGELHVYKFTSYQEAYTHALGLGLNMAYEQQHYTHNQLPLHPAANAIEHHVLAASLGSMGTIVSRAQAVPAERRSLTAVTSGR